MKKAKQNYKTKYFYSLLLIMILPIIIIYISSYVYYQYSVEKTKLETITYYSESLDDLEISLYDSLEEIKNLSSFIVYNPLAKEYILDLNQLTSDTYFNISEVRDFLISYANANTMIDNIAIFDNVNSYVVSTKGTSESSLFFESIMKYDHLNIETLNTLKFGSNHFKLFPVDIVNDRDIILPFVSNQFGSLISSKKIILNLKANEFIKLFNQYLHTENSQLFMTDDSGYIYCSTLSGDDNTNRLYSQSDFASLEDSIMIKDDSELIYMKKETLLFNEVYNYIVIIPMHDINKQYDNIRTIYFTSSLLLLLFTVALVYFASKRLYSPIKNILSSVNSKDNNELSTPNNNKLKSMGELEYIDYSLQSLISQNSHLNDGLVSNSHYLKVHYLHTLLQDNIFDKPVNVSDKLNALNIQFNYDFFCVVTMQYNFFSKFYTEFTEEEQKKLLQGTLELFNTFYSPHIVNTVTLDKNSIAFIINVNHATTVDSIKNTADELFNLFAFDKNLITFKIGIGMVYQFINGIHFSYTESLLALRSITSTGEQVLIYNKSSENIPYNFSYSSEHKLTNYILSGNEKAVQNLLHKVYTTNIDLLLKDAQYLTLYSIIAKLVNKIASESIYVKLNSEDQINEVIPNDDNETFETYYQNAFNTLIEYTSQITLSHIAIHTQNDVTTILSFIDQHFTEDLSLDYLADQFNYSSKYLSKLLNAHLDEGYKNYVSQKRIELAKDLLINSTKTINHIVESTGFNHRNSFIRTFKNIEGITPSAYRSLYSK